MLRFTKTLLATSCLLAATAAYAASDYVILEVGDREIKKSEVDTLWSGLFPAGQVPAFDKMEEPIKQNVLRGIVSEHLLYDEALKMKIDQDEAVKRNLDEAKRKLVVRAFMEKKMDQVVSEADVKAEYDKEVAAMKGKEEVRARHILVDSEDKAKELKKKIDGGAAFDKLASENSTDPGSKAKGGDLGYFTEDKMVAEFGKAAFALKKGEVSDVVKSPFGWHIIKLEDRRKVKAPTFTESKEALKSKLAEQRLNDYVNKLVDSTGVKYFDASGKEKDLTKSPAPKAD